jgi:ubiquitin-conjugating enzyme E2 Z
MTSLAIKRVTRDIMSVKKDPLEDQGIYIHWNDEDLMKVKACILGPENTPYQYGYYLFDIKFTNEYPHKPPEVIYQTRNSNIRFNPNLYTCGKVCVSILNTWSGPQWTSCQSLRSVLLSLQSLLTEKPLQNEPGYENENGTRSQNYNEVIEHENFRVAIISIIKSPGSFDIFLPQIREEYIKNYKNIIHCLQIGKEKEKKLKIKKITSPIYSMTIIPMYKNMEKELELIYSNFVKDS